MLRLAAPLTALLIVLTVLFPACSPPSQEDVATPPNKFARDSTLIAIADAQDRRETAQLLPYLQHEKWEYREAAAMAFGSVQDTLALPLLFELLHDEYEVVQEAAAYAIGQTRHISGAAPLLAVLKKPGVTLAIIAAEALGKCGDSTHLAEFIALTHGPDHPAEAIARGLFQFGGRKIVSEDAASIALRLAGQDAPKVSPPAAAFLARARTLPPISDPEKLIATFRKVTDTDTKQHLARAFARCNAPACREALIAVLEGEADYRVKVNAIMALQKQPNAALNPLMQRLAVHSNTHVAVSAARYLHQHGKPSHNINFVGLAAQQAHWRPSAMLLGAGLKVHSAPNRSTADLEDLQNAAKAAFDNSTNPYEKGHLLVAMAENPDNEAFLVTQMLRKEKVVSVYAMQGLDQMYGATTKQNAAARLLTLQSAIETGDVSIMAQAAGRLRDNEALREAVSDDTFLETALNSLELPAEIEIYNAIEATLAAVRGEEIDAPTPAPWSNPIDWEMVKRIPKKQVCIFKTEKGDIHLQLRVEDAPGSVANFVKLGLDGFYDNAVLHRVVPNFVAQGGDPRGDGWGSGPETIRSEWPNLHYQAGSVGLASAGKDTESCQWFISHCSTPHLDGRYTIFAEVIKGMDVVHQLQVGDRISKADFPGMSR